MQNSILSQLSSDSQFDLLKQLDEKIDDAQPIQIQENSLIFSQILEQSTLFDEVAQLQDVSSEDIIELEKDSILQQKKDIIIEDDDSDHQIIIDEESFFVSLEQQRQCSLKDRSSEKSSDAIFTKRIDLVFDQDEIAHADDTFLIEDLGSSLDDFEKMNFRINDSTSFENSFHQASEDSFYLGDLPDDILERSHQIHENKSDFEFADKGRLQAGEFDQHSGVLKDFHFNHMQKEKENDSAVYQKDLQYPKSECGTEKYEDFEISLNSLHTTKANEKKLSKNQEVQEVQENFTEKFKNNDSLEFNQELSQRFKLKASEQSKSSGEDKKSLKLEKKQESLKAYERQSSEQFEVKSHDKAENFTLSNRELTASADKIPLRVDDKFNEGSEEKSFLELDLSDDSDILSNKQERLNLDFQDQLLTSTTSQRSGSSQLFSLNSSEQSSIVQQSSQQGLATENISGQIKLSAAQIQRFEHSLPDIVKFSLSQQGKKAHIILNPQELGEVSIDIETLKNGHYKVKIVTQTEESHELFTKHQNLLEEFFNQNAEQGSEFTFDFEKQSGEYEQNF